MNVVEMIKEFESLELEPYICPAGKLTVGYGHCITKTSPYNRRITEAEANMLLSKDIADSAKTVLRYCKTKLTKYQLDALSSFVMNVGPGNFQKSTLLKRLNENLMIGAAKEFEKWIYGNGKKLPGLVRRRKMERELFEGKYE